MSCGNGQQLMPQAIARAILDAMTGEDGAFDTSTLRLYNVNVTLTPTTPLAALTPPTFTGYAPAAAIVFAPAINGPSGSAVTLAPSHLFACTGGTPSDTIYGWLLTNAGNTELRLAVPLVTPVQIAVPGDGVDIQPEIVFSGR